MVNHEAIAGGSDEPDRRKVRRSLARMGLAAGLLLAAVLAVSCNVNGVGIFYGLQNEKKIATTSTGLSNKLTIGSMVLVSGYYYAATGKIYVAANAAGIGTDLNWSALSPPVSGAICTQLVSMGTAGPLYAIFVTDSAPTVASITGSALVYEGAVNADGSVTWTQVPAFASMYAQNLMVLNGNLFVDVSTTVTTDPATTDTQYSLYEMTSSTTSAEITLGGQTNLVTPIIAGAYDSGTSTYWFASGANLYSGATVPGTSTTFTPDNPAPPSGLDSGNLQFSALYYSPLTPTSLGTSTPSQGGLGALFASTRNGYLYAWVDASTAWTAASTVANSGLLVGLNGIIDTGSLFGTTDAVLVASDIGYYEVSTGGIGIADGSLSSGSSLSLVTPTGDNDLTTDLNYTAAALHNITILNFLLDSTNASDVRIFALTAGGAATVTGGGGGLWRNEPTGSGSRTWSQD